jgi:uncharacterized protein (TIGR02391 family)
MLSRIISSVDELLAMPVEVLGPIMLKIAASISGPTGFTYEGVTQVTIGTGIEAYRDTGYPPDKKMKVDAHVGKTWNWLERHGFFEPVPGINGRNGWRILTQEGREVAEGKDIAQVRAALDFPKTLIHPSIREKVYGALLRNDLDEAVFFAFKAVEVAVRDAGKYAATDIGVDLMRKAFDPSDQPTGDRGRLTDPQKSKGEREALSHLFAGAIGSYKNPHSHRTVSLTDLTEAQEQVMLATHLLRIVEARKP